MSLEKAKQKLESMTGRENEPSNWLAITQEMIDAFGEATGDKQWIHVNPGLASKFSPFGTTVAHGFFTLSLIPHLTGAVDAQKPLFESVKLAVNYGLNRVRFPSPVKSGARIRAKSTVASWEEIKGGVQVVNNVVIEIEGEAKPACAAEMVARYYF